MCALPTSCDLPLPRSEPGNLPVKSVRRARSRSEPIGDRAGRSHPSRQLKFFSAEGRLKNLKKKKNEIISNILADILKVMEVVIASSSGRQQEETAEEMTTVDNYQTVVCIYSAYSAYLSFSGG